MTATWDALRASVQPPVQHVGNVAARFVMPPFSVLDTMSADWQARKRQWLALGLQSEVGRGLQGGVGAVPMTGSAGDWNKAMRDGQADARAFRLDLMRGEDGGAYAYSKADGAAKADTVALWDDGPAAVDAYGVSIFDPVLCELVYRWWAPPGGSVLDPFAGGSVRGVVASQLGHPYLGVDLSQRQVEANQQQAVTICSDPVPMWLTGDSLQVVPLLTGQHDLVFTCPPYYDLEQYSTDPLDLSAMPTYAEFLVAYRAILRAASARLRDGRFAVVVVSEVRDKAGHYVGLVPDTVRAMTDAGLAYYNEAILVNSAGSLPLRITKQFEAGRKLGRRHQNVLVFLKGQQPRGWSYDRDAPPDPQLDLGLPVVLSTAAPVDTVLVGDLTAVDAPGRADDPPAPTDTTPAADVAAQADGPREGGYWAAVDTSADDYRDPAWVDAAPWLLVDPLGRTPVDHSDTLRDADGNVWDRATGALVERAALEVPTLSGSEVAARYEAAMTAALHKHLRVPVTAVQRATDEQDLHHATDFVAMAGANQVGYRVRDIGEPSGGPDRDRLYPRDFTLRSRARHGGLTELDKVKAGEPRWYIYAWGAAGGLLAAWVIVDMDLLRDQKAWAWASRPQRNADGSEFIGIPLWRMSDAGLIVAASAGVRAVEQRVGDLA